MKIDEQVFLSFYDITPSFYLYFLFVPVVMRSSPKLNKQRRPVSQLRLGQRSSSMGRLAEGFGSEELKVNKGSVGAPAILPKSCEPPKIKHSLTSMSLSTSATNSQLVKSVSGFSLEPESDCKLCVISQLETG